MTFNSVLRRIVYIGIFVIPFFIFYVADPLYFPFISGKNFAFRIVTEIILVSWFVLALRDKDYRPKKTWILWSVLAFIVVAILATVLGEDPYRSFWSNYERMDGLVNLLHVVAYFLVVVSVFTKDLWQKWLHTTMGASVIMGIYVLSQIFGFTSSHQGANRVDGTFGNPTYLGVYALFHVFFALYFLLPIIAEKKILEKKWLTVFCGLTFLLNLVGLYYTATRGVILGFLGGVALVSILFAVLGKGFLRKTGIGIIVVLAIVVIGFFATKDTQFVKESKVLSRFANISWNDDTTKARLIIWGMGIKGFKEHPVLGWGQENFNLVFNKYYDPRLYAQEQWFDRSHNIFVDWLVQAGILGLLAYISLFASVLYLLWKKGDFSIEEKIVLTGLLAAYIFQNLFVFDNLYSYIMFFSMLGYVHTRSSGENARVWVGTNINQTAVHSLASLILIGICFSLYLVNIKPIRAGAYIIDGLSPKEGTVESSIKYFRKAISLNTFGSREASEQLLSQATRVVRDNFTTEEKGQIVNFAKSEMDREINSSPNDARGYVLLGSTLRSIGLAQEALPYLEKSRELSPHKQTILFELGVAYMDTGEFGKAEEILKEAFESAPEFETSRILYASSLIYLKRTKEAEDLLKEAFGGIPADSNLVNAYAKIKDYAKLVKIWQAQVDSDPENPGYHLSLAASYLAIGEPSKAIAEIKKAMELDPNFRAQGEQYIKDILAGKKLI